MVIDLELVYDVWSLLFCCIRSKVPTLKNDDYLKIVGQSVKQSIDKLIENADDRVAV